MNKSSEKILVVDDDQEVRNLIAGVLSDEGYSPYQASNEKEAISQIRSNQPDLIFLDLWIENDESAGLKILKKIKGIDSEIPVIIISGHGTIDVAMEAMRDGAFDFIEKPFVIDRLLLTTKRAIELCSLKKENLSLKNEKLYSDVFSVGKSSFAKSINKKVEKIASSNSNVYINSCVGIAAESIAYQVHKKSFNKDKKFMHINCISSDTSKFEDEFFGTEKLYGYLEKVSDGTIFLEDIDNISKGFQQKLLMLLQTGRISLNSRTIYSLARIVCSSSGSKLLNLVDKSLFSTELFYRLNVAEINIPSIKDRNEDILPIVDYYLKMSENFFGLLPKKFTDNAITILQSYDWPGNIQQIKNTVESSLINAIDSDDGYINESHLPHELTSEIKNKFESLDVAKFMSLPLKEAKDFFEADYLSVQINRFSGNVSQAADFIGMERSALHRKMTALNIRKNIRKKRK
jgi:two-component system nitrogen regulation response regulator NtrX